MDKIRIRKYKISDVKRFYELSSDIRMHEYRGCIQINSLNEAERLMRVLKKAYSNGYIYMMAIEVNKEFIGNLSIKYIDKYVMMIGYWIGYEYQGKGYCTQVIGELNKQLGNKYKLIMQVMEENEASIRVLEKNNFKRVSREINQGEVILTYSNK